VAPPAAAAAAAAEMVDAPNAGAVVREDEGRAEAEAGAGAGAASGGRAAAAIAGAAAAADGPPGTPSTATATTSAVPASSVSRNTKARGGRAVGSFDSPQRNNRGITNNGATDVSAVCPCFCLVVAVPSISVHANPLVQSEVLRTIKTVR
jgi:hypothetical protein